jgi:hypothetical protein
MSWVSPHSGQASDAFRGDGEVGAGAHEDFFQAADECDRAEGLVQGGRSVRRFTSKSPQIEDGISDDLAGPVEGDVATAVAFEEFDTALGKEFRRRDHVGCFCIAAQRYDRRMFQQKQDIADFFFLAESDKLALQAKAGCIIDCAELDERDQINSPRITTDSHGSTPRIYSW